MKGYSLNLTQVRFMIFYEKLTVSVEALETLRKLRNSNGYVRDTFCRIAGIMADLVILGCRMARLGVL